MQMISSWGTHKWSEEFDIYTYGLSKTFIFSVHVYDPNISVVWLLIFLDLSEYIFVYSSLSFV